MNEENTVKTDLDIEREQLNILIKRGVKFDVITKLRRRKKGWKGWFQKPEITEEVTSYEIHEPTLSVLDRLSEIGLDLAIDEEELKNGKAMPGAKKLAKNNAKKMARVLAIAVLGEDYYITEITKTGKVKKYNDDKELDRLTSIFFHSIKPSKLALLTATITNVSNLADFITSMRFVSGARTTIPIAERIE